MLLKAVIPLCLSVATAQTVVSTFTYTVTQSADFAPETILDVHLNDTALVDEVWNHGCFCSKIYHWNDKNIRGGHSSLDDFDEICKNWFRCRECNDKHTGGSCKDGGVDPHETVAEYEIVQNVLDDGNVVYDCSSNSDPCAYDSCVIDVEYVEQVAAYLESTPGFAGTAVNSTSCPRSSEQVISRFCNGTAPYLYTTKQRTVATANEVLAENSALLQDEISDPSIDAEGTTCADGSCNCSGGSASANVLYFRTTVNKNWDDGKALCESMGLTMATARTTAENDVLSSNQPNSWIGGRRYHESNYNTWIWDIDLTVINPVFWNGGEPNNAGGSERCLQMYSSSRWNDLSCSNSLRIVCEQRTCP